MDHEYLLHLLDCESVLITRISSGAVSWAPVSLILPAIIIYVTAAVGECCAFPVPSRCSPFVVYISYPSSGTSHFSPELHFLFLTDALAMRVWVLGVCETIGMSLFSGPLCQNRRGIYEHRVPYTENVPLFPRVDISVSVQHSTHSY